MSRSIDVPWRALVARADPDHAKKKTREVEYEFSNGRRFVGNPDRRGPYSED
jgi:hypothetical protein